MATEVLEMNDLPSDRPLWFELPSDPNSNAPTKGMISPSNIERASFTEGRDPGLECQHISINLTTVLSQSAGMYGREPFKRNSKYFVKSHKVMKE